MEEVVEETDEIVEEEKKIVNEACSLVKLQRKLERKCKSRGFVVTEDDIIDEIEDAVCFVNNRRKFIPTPDCLYPIEYGSIIVKLALDAISKYGAEGETSHSENGISRSYENGGNYSYTLVAQVPPVASTPE